MEEFRLDEYAFCHIDIVDAINRKCSEIIEEHVSSLRYKWRENKSHSINDGQAGKYIRVLQYSYYDTCNCNARMKLEYSISSKVISLYWYTFGYSHAMPSNSIRFLTFNCHASFQHVRLEQDCEFDSNRNSVQMTIELKEFIEEIIEESPSMSPRVLFKEVQNHFVNYSQRYWSKCYKSICSYRLTLQKKLKETGHGSEKFHNVH